MTSALNTVPTGTVRPGLEGTTTQGRAAAAREAHNLEVAGSSPAPATTAIGSHLAAIDAGIARAQSAMARETTLSPYDLASVLIRNRAAAAMGDAIIALRYGLNQRASRGLVEGYAYWLACDAFAPNREISQALLQSLREDASDLDRQEGLAVQTCLCCEAPAVAGSEFCGGCQPYLAEPDDYEQDRDGYAREAAIDRELGR